MELLVMRGTLFLPDRCIILHGTALHEQALQAGPNTTGALHDMNTGVDCYLLEDLTASIAVKSQEKMYVHPVWAQF